MKKAGKTWKKGEITGKTVQNTLSNVWILYIERFDNDPPGPVQNYNNFSQPHTYSTTSIDRFWGLFFNAHHDDLTKSVDVKGLKIHVVSCFTVKEHHFRVWHTHMYHIRLNFEDSTNIRSFPLNLPQKREYSIFPKSRFKTFRWTQYSLSIHFTRVFLVKTWLQPLDNVGDRLWYPLERFCTRVQRLWT